MENKIDAVPVTRSVARELDLSEMDQVSGGLLPTVSVTSPDNAHRYEHIYDE